MSRRALLLVVALTVGLLSACAGARPAGSLLPPLHRRCRSAARHSAPLVTEWPAAEKANLEALLRRGGVAVAYSGCELHVLTECRAPGAYAWMRTTPANDVLEIEGADELYAKLPLGAVSLEGELAPELATDPSCASPAAAGDSARGATDETSWSLCSPLHKDHVVPTLSILSLRIMSHAGGARRALPPSEFRKRVAARALSPQPRRARTV